MRTCILTGDEGENPDDCTTHDHETFEYEVSVVNSFEAESQEDAVRQMVEWLQENAGRTGYRVRFPTDREDRWSFIDADDL